MANRFCVVDNGNWNNTATWSTTYNGAGGASVPVAGDTAMANGKTVNVNVNATCTAVRSDNTGSAVQGGKFLLADGVTLTANVYAGAGTAGTGCVEYAGNSPNQAYIVGNVLQSMVSSATQHGAKNTGTGTLSITGQVGPATANSYNYGAYNASTGTVNITGDTYGPNGGTGSYGALNAVAGTINFTGNLYAGYSTYGYAFFNGSTGNVSVTGDVIAAASGTTGISVALSNLCAMEVNGALTPSTANSAVYIAVAGAFVSVKTINTASNHRPAISGNAAFLKAYQNTGIVYNLYDRSGNDVALKSEEAFADYPAQSNVRLDTTYGNNNLHGSLAVPDPAHVALGIATDNTFGTAILTEANIRSAVGMASANLDTQLSGISAKTTNLPASPAAVGSAMTLTSAYDAAKTAAAQASVNAIPTTPLLAANYTAPPSVSAIRAEMDANSTKLANLDVAVSTRLAPAGTLATVTTLTNAPDFPTEAEIAAAVWGYVTRTLTAGVLTPQQVWEYVSVLMPDGAEALLAAVAARLAEQVETGPVVVIPAPASGKTTVYVTCYDETGELEEGVDITIACIKASDPGAFDSTPVVITSDATGLASGSIPRGAGLKFTAKRGSNGKAVKFFGVDADTLALPPLLGAP